MNQVLHILRKDLRHHWPEIAASLALLAAFCYFDVRSWHYAGAAYAISGGWFLDAQFLPGLTAFLLPVSWVFLVVRVIQGESLVGDRQFWVTRPYLWQALLAAKVLFLLLVIHIPLFIADVILLSKAGFSPSAYVAGLLWMHGLVFAVIVLSAMTLAAVTGSILQWVLAGVGVIVYLIGMSIFSSYIPSASLASSSDGSLAGGLYVAVAAVVILLQYSRRRTRRSWLLLAAFAVVLLVFVVADHYSDDTSKRYPPLATGDVSAVRLQLAAPPPPPANAQQFDEGAEKMKQIWLSMPFDVSGVAEDGIVSIDGLSVALAGPHGEQWKSRWQQVGRLVPAPEKRVLLGFLMSTEMYRQWKLEPVKARMRVAVSVFRDANRHEFVPSAGDFRMPDIGWCRADWSIRCRAPLRGPAFVFARVMAEDSTCPRTPGQAAAPAGAVLWGESRHRSAPADFGISPIKEVSLSPASHADMATFAGVCPGTRMTLSNPQFVRRYQVELRLDQLRLYDYAYRPEWRLGR